MIQSRVIRENKPISSFGGGGGGLGGGTGNYHPGEMFHSESYDINSGGGVAEDSNPVFQVDSSSPSHSGTSTRMSKKQKQQNKMTSVLTQTSVKRLLRPAAVSVAAAASSTSSSSAASSSSLLSPSHPRSSNHYYITKEKTNWNTVLTRGDHCNHICAVAPCGIMMMIFIFKYITLQKQQQQSHSKIIIECCAWYLMMAFVTF